MVCWKGHDGSSGVVRVCKKSKIVCVCVIILFEHIHNGWFMVSMPIFTFLDPCIQSRTSRPNFNKQRNVLHQVDLCPWSPHDQHFYFWSSEHSLSASNIISTNKINKKNQEMKRPIISRIIKLVNHKDRESSQIMK